MIERAGPAAGRASPHMTTDDLRRTGCLAARAGLFDRALPRLREVTRRAPDRAGDWLNLGALPLCGLRGGGMQTIRLQVDLGGRIAEEIYVEGRELAVKRGRACCRR